MISAVILTKNEERNIKECLDSLKWCDEVVVIDDNSQDKTREMAKKMGAKVFERTLGGDFAAQRNFGIGKAEGDWVIFVDADERVDNKLVEEIRESVKNQEYSGFFVKRNDFIFGRFLKYGETAGVKLLKLARKGSGEWARPVHEVWEVTGNIGDLKTPLLHYPHQTITDFLKDINFYTDLNAKFLYQRREWVGIEAIILYPLAKFIVNYFLKLGFLDGTAGLMVAIMMSFHSFLTRGKLWSYYNRKPAE